MLHNVIAIISVFMVLLTMFERVFRQKRRGIKANLLCRHHIMEFVIYPYVLLLAYHVLAYSFNWPKIWGAALNTVLIPWGWLDWVGDLLCPIGMVIFVWCIQSFGAAFRLGVDYEHPQPLITTGIYAYTRNPMYVAYDLITLGLFLIYPTPLFFIFGLGCWSIFFRQTVIEEEFLREYHGEAFTAYCRKVGRFFKEF